MRATLRNGGCFRSRLAIAILESVPALCQTQSATPDSVAQTQTADAQPGETHSERFWLAGRYDGNRIIVYFDAVKFNGTVPSIAEELTDPVVAGFFLAVKLPWAYVAKLQQNPEPSTSSGAIGTICC